MNRSLLPFALVAALAGSACTITLPPTSPSADPQPVIVSSGPAGKTPVIQSFTANPTNVTKGQPITFQVVAHDPNGETLQFNWSATGGTLSATTGQALMWTPPETPGVYTVMVTVTNGRGGIVTGSQNLTVQADGSTKRVDASPQPTPASSNTPSAAPSAPPSNAPSVTPSASPTTVPPSIAPSATPVTVGGSDFRLDNFKMSDFQQDAPYDPDQLFFFRVTSATQPVTNYSHICSEVVGNSPHAGMSYGPIYPGGYTEYKGHRAGIYMLVFYKPDLPDQHMPSLWASVGKDTGIVGFNSITHPTPIARANWQGNIPADKKDMNGCMFLFKYEGKTLNLGTFELP